VHLPLSYATRWQTKRVKIPLVYAQLIGQLVAEDKHGGHNNGHEAVRRQSYARDVLEAVGKELRRIKGDYTLFRSKVLNPILQRYLRGVPDSYTPSIRAAISGDDEPTIADATKFYLAKDPVDPVYLPHYRRNLLYIVESRWYLGILLGEMDLKSKLDFNRIRVHHDNIMEALADEDDTDSDSTSQDKDDADTSSEDDDEETPAALNEVEVRTIFDEGLEGCFADELEAVVRAIPSTPINLHL
jgi:hypothetical protein